jgi:hypothetical protein
VSADATLIVKRPELNLRWALTRHGLSTFVAVSPLAEYLNKKNAVIQAGANRKLISKIKDISKMRENNMYFV